MSKPISIITLLAMSLTLVGCGSRMETTTTTDTPAPNPNPTATRAAVVPPTQPPVTPPTPIRDAVEKALSAGEGKIFPKGTTLKSADLNDGTVTLDMSKEFNKLGDMGDSVESAAQKTLREAVATIPTVEKMRVTVEGKPYDSQMTDWATPFSVRDTSKDNDIPKGAGTR